MNIFVLLEYIQMNINNINGIGDRLLDIIGMSVINHYMPHVATQFAWLAENPQRSYDICLFNSFDKFNILFSHHPFSTPYCYNSGASFNPYYITEYLKQHNICVDLQDVIHMYIHHAQRIDVASTIKTCCNIQPSFVGIHIRRTDKLGAYDGHVHETSNREFDVIISRLKDKITKLIEEGYTNFFVCSDDDVYLQDFVHWLESVGRVHVVTTLGVTREQYGWREVLDFFSLTQCGMILQGTKYSTFSLVASIISQRVLWNFADPVHNWLFYIWQPCCHSVTCNDGEVPSGTIVNLERMLDTLKICYTLS